MEVKILDKSQENLWDDFIKNHQLATIHQFSGWGHFQASIPARGKYWILAIFKDGKIIGGSMIIRHKMLKKYCWLYSARGPILDYNNQKTAQEQMNALLSKLKEIAKQEKAIFYRIDPPLEFAEPPRTELHQPSSPVMDSQATASHTAPPKKKPTASPTTSSTVAHIHGFKETTHGFQPDHTLILDLTKDENTLLSEMKPKGRYNIKLAQKKGVTIEKSTDIESFYKILKETTERDNFTPHNQAYYEKMLTNLQENAVLYIAKYNDQPIAGLINTTFADTSTYYFGASSNAHRELMAPYLLQWTAILDAKNKGLKKYDFLGISPDATTDSATQKVSPVITTTSQNHQSSTIITTSQNKPTKSHPWAGVTQFKLKFGGERKSYQKAREYALNPLLYLAYKSYKKLK